MAKTIALVLLVVAAVGCGGSGSGAAGGHGGTGSGGMGGAGGATSCGPVTPIGTSGSGTMSWKDNGTLECPLLAIVDRTIGTQVDTFEIDATTASSLGIDIALSSTAGPVGGTYSCQPGNGTSQPDVMLEIIGLNGSGFSAMSGCTITIAFTTDATGAEHAQGTFSGTLTGASGSDTITDGAFDLTVALTGG
jgi:hypothetical protein